MGTAIIDARGSLVSISTLTAPLPLIADGCIAYYKLDNNGSGGVSLADSSGNGNTLQNYGAITSSGIINNSASFTPEAYIDSDNALSLNTSYSFSLWINVNDTQASPFTRIIEVGALSSFSLEIDELLAVNVYQFSEGVGNGISISNALTPNVWNHIAVKINTSEMKAFLNGSLVGSVESITQDTYSDILHIARYGGETEGFNLNGKIDELGFWNRSLSDNEILALYNNGLGLTYPFMN
jgi:hypothetical protein